VCTEYISFGITCSNNQAASDITDREGYIDSDSAVQVYSIRASAEIYYYRESRPDRFGPLLGVEDDPCPAPPFVVGNVEWQA
jgi:hypothetical protein